MAISDKNKLCVFIISMIVTSVHSTVQENVNVEDDDDGSWTVLYKILMNCSKQPEFILCLKIKAVHFMDKTLAVKTPVYITDYLSLSTEPEVEQNESTTEMPVITEYELQNILPETLEERNEEVDKMLQDRVDRFLDTRSLQFTFPTDSQEGRKKKEKMGGAFIAGGLAVAGLVAQLMLGKVALIAGKALLIAKKALVLSAVVAAKKLFGGGGGGHDSGGDSHGGGWMRRNSASPDESSQYLAYRNHYSNYRENEV